MRICRFIDGENRDIGEQNKNHRLGGAVISKRKGNNVGGNNE